MRVFSDGTSELPQTISGLAWGDAYIIGAGISVMTGNASASALDGFSLSPSGSQVYSRSTTIISTDEEYSREISAGASGSYNMDGVKLSAEASYLNRMTYSETSLTVLVQCEVADAEYETIENPTLTSDALNIMQSSTEKFRDIYGDYFISGARKGALLTVSLICRSDSSSRLDDFKSKVSASQADLFSASGFANFQQLASSTKTSITFDIDAQGVKPGSTPPDVEDPAKILSWFEQNLALVPRYAYLTNYSSLYSDFPTTIDIAPSVFADIQALYQKAWLTKNRFSTCPGDYADAFANQYNKVIDEVEVAKPGLPSDPSQITTLDSGLDDVLTLLQPIFNRYDLRATVAGLASTEPATDHDISASSGNVWLYGIDSWSATGVSIASQSYRYDQKWHVGHREHTFTLGGSSSVLIVGWRVDNLWRSGTNGSWKKTSGQILLSDLGTVYVRSDYDRGLAWEVTTYFVDSSLYDFDAASKGAISVNRRFLRLPD